MNDYSMNDYVKYFNLNPKLLKRNFYQFIKEKFLCNIESNVIWNLGTDYQCLIEDYVSEFNFISKKYIITKNNKVILKNNNFNDSFLLLCFLAQKENCKAPDIMQWLSDISSKEEYIERAKYIREKIQYRYPCSVVFDGEEKDIFNEEKDYDGMAGMLNVRETEDYYEVYYDFYPERSNHRVQQTVAIIYDKSLLYAYLLNKQFDLLQDRAEGKLPLLTI